MIQTGVRLFSFSPKVQKNLAKNFLSAQMESYAHFLKFGLSQPFHLFRFHRFLLQRPSQSASEDSRFFKVCHLEPEPPEPPYWPGEETEGERFLFCDFEFLPERFKLKPPEQSYVQCLKTRTSFTCGLFMPVKIRLQNCFLGHTTESKQHSFVVWFLMAHIPLMTRHGHFLIRGVPRVILSQMVRSPGVYFKQQTFSKMKPPSANERVGFHVDIIAHRGAWLRLQAKSKSKVRLDAHRFTHEQGGLELSVALKSQPRLPLNAFLRGFGLKPSVLVPLYLSLKRGFLVSNQRNMTSSAGALKRCGSCVVLPFNVDHIDRVKFNELALKRRLNRLPRFSEIRKDGDMSKAYEFWLDKVHLGRKPQGLTNFAGLNFVFCQSLVFAQRTLGFGVLPKRFVRLQTSLKSEKFHLALSRCLTPFQQTMTYDLGFHGRQALNRNLGTTGASRVLTAEDMACACFYLFEACRGNVTETRLDHLSQKRLKPVGDLLTHVMEVGFLNFKNTLEQQNMFFSDLTYGETPLPSGPDGRFVQAWLHSALGLNRAYFFKRHRLNTSDVKSVSKAYLVHLNTMVRRLKRKPNKAKPKTKPEHVHYQNNAHVPRKVKSKSGWTGQTQPRYVMMQNQTLFKTCLKRVFKPFFRPSSFNAALKQFFNSNPLSQFLDQTNPLAELTHKRRLSFMGLGGLHKQNATMAARSIDPSHLGRLCPIETPEGQNAGLVHSLTCLTRMTHHDPNQQKQLSRLGFPSYKNYVFPQTLLHVNHGDEKPMVHGGLKQTPFLSNTLSKLGFVREGASKTWFQKPLSGVEFISVGALQNISLATCCIPFMQHNDGNRALMGSNMQRQALSLATAETPIVRTGWESQIHVDDSAEQARQSGFVVRVESQNLILVHENAFKPKHTMKQEKGSLNPNPKPGLGANFHGATGFGKPWLKGKRDFVSWLKTHTVSQKASHLKLNAPFHIWFNMCFQDEQTFAKKQPRLTSGCEVKLNQARLKNNVFSKPSVFVSWHAKTSLKRTKNQILVHPSMFASGQTKPENVCKPFRLGLKTDFDAMQTWLKHVWVPALTLAHEAQVLNPFWTEANQTQPWFENGFSDSGFKRKNTRLRLTKTHLPGAYGGNQGTLRLHKPCLGFASWVKRGQALTNTACSQLGLLALGRNLLLGYTPWQGYNFEDAILINQSLVLGDVLTSLHVQSLVLKTQAPPKILLKSDGSDQKDRKYENAPDFETTRVSLRTQDHALTHDPTESERFYDIHGVLKPGCNIGPGVHLWSKGQTWIPRGKEPTGEAGLWTRLNLGKQEPTNMTVVDTSIKAGVNVCGRLLRVFKPKQPSPHPGRQMGFGKKTHPKHTGCAPWQNMASWWLKPALNTPFDPANRFDFFMLDFGSSDLRRTTKQSHLGFISQQLLGNKRPRGKHLKHFEARLAKQESTRRKKLFKTWAVKSDLLGKKTNHHDRVCFYFESQTRTQTRLDFEKKRFLRLGFEKPNAQGKTKVKRGEPKQNLVFSPEKTKRFIHGVFQQNAKRSKKRFLLKKQNGFSTRNTFKKGLKKAHAVKKTKHSDLPSSLRLTYVTPRRIQVGDKLSGRHGNKGIVSRILPSGSMPYLPDGTALDLALNPLGVPSRMNVGQLFECLLAFAGSLLKQNFRLTSFDSRFGSEASRSLSYAKLYEARLKTAQAWVFNPNFPGKVRCFDGRSGQAFLQPLTVGKPYMLKLIHVVDDKIHARSSGPYSLVTQQPLRGRSKNGGQRVGEMEVWALQGYGAAHILHELLSLKSDSMLGRETVSDALLFQASLKFDLPESFKVLSHECQCLGLDLSLKANHHLCSQTFHPEKRWRLVKPNLSLKF